VVTIDTKGKYTQYAIRIENIRNAYIGLLAATMQMRFVFILTFGLTINSWGQTPEKKCDCPSNKYAGSDPETTFHLTNGKEITLCGYADTKDNEKLYSEFVLAECGQDKVIDFWDALTVCRIKTNKDTLIIEELKNLPTGDNFAFKATVWRIEKLYFKLDQIQRQSGVNRRIKKYSQKEIKSVLKEVEAMNGKLNYDNMDLAYKLFVAAISGDSTARKYLTDKTRFGTLDGAFAEDYEELIAMLKSW